MKILKEVSSEAHFSAYFEDDGMVFYADLAILGSLEFTECMIFKARKSNKTDSGYVVPYWIDLYFAEDIPFTRESLMTCIKEFCRVTDEVSDGGSK